MSNLFGSQPKVIPEFTGLQVNTAVQVLPIPIIYGGPRINVNLIYYNGFFAVQKKTGGKGVLSGGKGGSTTEYFATLILAIGEGPLGTTQIIYQDANVFVPADYPTNGAYYFNGTDNQPPWPVVTFFWPNDARPYKDTAYYGFYNAQLDSSATVPQIDLVVRGIYAGTSPLNNSTLEITTGQYDTNGKPLSYIGPIPLGTIDADPAFVILDFLTNTRYGATFPIEWIDLDTVLSSDYAYQAGIGDAALSTYCQAIGFAWSVAINNVESAASILERWLKNLNVAAVWTGSVLKFIPYWENYSETNPNWDPTNGIPQKFFQPDVTVKALVSMDYILQAENKEDDPITFSRKDPMEVYNTVRVDFKDRNNFFNDVPAEAKDEAHIELYGPRVDNIGLANEFSLDIYAFRSATLQLRRNIGIIRTFTWKMGPLWAWLNPMDVILIPDPVNYINSVAVRIVSVEDDEEENMTIVAEEFGWPVEAQDDTPARAVARDMVVPAFTPPPFGAVGPNSPTTIPMSPTTPPDQGAINSPPQAVYPPVIFEPSTTMLTALGYATPQFILGASAGNTGLLDPNWGGCQVWISLDDMSYELIGQLVGPSTIGYITSPLPAYGGTNPDNTDTLYVYLGQSNGSLDMSSPSAAAAGHSICVVQDVNGYEVLSYTTATLVNPFTYALTGLYRGFYGSAPRAFSAGSKFLYVGTNSNVLTGSLPASYIGQNFFVKLQSFSTFQNVEQDLSEVTAYEYFVSGPAIGVTLLLTDNATTTDFFLLAGEYVAIIEDGAILSDLGQPTAVVGASLSDTVASSEYLTLPSSSWVIGDTVVSSDILAP